MPPLYRIIKGKDKIIYLKDDLALYKYKQEHQKEKFIVNRLKGLGELSEDETTILVDPEQRILTQITMNDVKSADSIFEDLMGSATSPKKEFVKKYSHLATNFI